MKSIAKIWNKHVAQSSRLKLQYMSDLHLEVTGNYLDFHILKVAPYLLLAGDVGRFSQLERLAAFLKHQCSRFEKVLFVLGNHEFYGLDRQHVLESAASLEEDPDMMGRLTVLNRARVDLSDSVTILGCTLHSRIPDHAREIVERKIADFRLIQSWAVGDHNVEHGKDLEWLIGQIEDIQRKESHRTVIIATHHAPIIEGSSDPKNTNNPWTSAFSTDILPTLERDPVMTPVKYWIFGHTHWCADFMVGNVRLVSNQRGYVLNPQQEPKRAGATSFNSAKTISVG